MLSKELKRIEDSAPGQGGELFELGKADPRAFFEALKKGELSFPDALRLVGRLIFSNTEEDAQVSQELEKEARRLREKPSK